MAGATTEHGAPRGHRPRASRRALRAWASVAGILAFLVPTGALARSPEPPAEARRVLVIRRVLRRIVVVERRPTSTPVRYVVVGNGGGGAPVTSTRAS